MTDTNTYTATLVMTSKGDSPGVSFEIELSHDVEDKIVRGEALPACYSAMRDVQQFIRMAGSRLSFNIDDEEFFALPEEEQAARIKEAADAAEHTILVNRIIHE